MSNRDRQVRFKGITQWVKMGITQISKTIWPNHDAKKVKGSFVLKASVFKIGQTSVS